MHFVDKCVSLGAVNMKAGLFYVLIANIINLFINLLTNFIIPKYLSIDTYAVYKTYALYVGYAGFFSLGYNDGMYLKYGGVKLDQVDKRDLGNNFINYIAVEMLMFAIVVAIGGITKSMLMIAFAFGMLFSNVLGYLKSFYQATGEFKAYGTALNAEKIIILVLNIIFIFIVLTDSPYIYIWVQVVVAAIVSIWLLYRMQKLLGFINKGRLMLSEITENIRSGFILMMGNFSSSIFIGMDRWFVMILLTTTHFAMYSFAVSMEGILKAFVSPITISMYNYFCKNLEMEKIRRIKKLSLLWGFIIITAAFPAKWMLENYLQNYNNANEIMFLLFATQAFYVVINGVYVNLYKARKQQNIYLKQMIYMTVIAVILHAVLFFIFRNMVLIAAATLLTAVVWLFTCEVQDEKLRFSNKEYLFSVILLSIYLICGFKMNSIVGMFVYGVAGIICSFIFMKASFFQCVGYGLELINKLKSNAKIRGKE